MSKKIESQRVRITKMMIRKAFTELMREKPARSITVKELCDRAEVNRGTFYAHYRDVYDLLKQIEDELLIDFQTALSTLMLTPESEPVSARFCVDIFELLKEHADLCIALLGEHSDKQFVNKLVEYGKDLCISEYGKRYKNASKRQLEYYYAFISSGCIGVLQQWMANDMTDRSTEIARLVEQIMVKGIRSLESSIENDAPDKDAGRRLIGARR